MADVPFVYLDWAATAPLSLEAARAMAPYLEAGTVGLAQGNGNANALHTAGRDAFKTLEAARRDIARTLDARPSEIIFTSGATEADNAALIGIVEGVLAKRGVNIGYGSQANGKALEAAPSVIISAIEHDAVLEAAEVLRRRGIEVLFVKPDKRGIITPEALAHVLDAATDPLLVSIMALNNETGALADITQLAELAHRSGALFHSDATQAFGKIPLSVKQTGVDALSLSSHKIGGPKGVGAFFLKTRTPFGAQIVGGGQEANLRSGTQNIAGVVGFAAAAQASHEQLEAASAHMRALRDRLFAGLSELSGVEAFIDPRSLDYGPHIVTVLCPGFESETLILQLDRRGVCVSGGSACSSSDLEPSHVLSAMGIDRDRALGMVRFSLGPTTTEEDIDHAIRMLREVVK